MIQKLLTRIFGSRNERLLKDYRKVVERINALEPTVSALTDEQKSARIAGLEKSPGMAGGGGGGQAATRRR